MIFLQLKPLYHRRQVGSLLVLLLRDFARVGHCESDNWHGHGEFAVNRKGSGLDVLAHSEFAECPTERSDKVAKLFL